MTHKEISGPVYSIGDQVRDQWGNMGTVRQIRIIPGSSIPSYQHVEVAYETGTAFDREGRHLISTEASSHLYQAIVAVGASAVTEAPNKAA